MANFLGTILLNEVAPRPHNSGHYTIEGCYTSQFEQHLRAVANLPLGNPNLSAENAVMLNLLGSAKEEEVNDIVQSSIILENACVHLYGKSNRPGRKLGHITFIGPSLPKLLSSVGELTHLPTMKPRPVVGVIMGSDSDLPVMKAAAQILDQFNVAFELTIVSAHRTPTRLFSYAETAVKRGLKVIIAGAGGAAHLPGMIAAITTLPVIGVPVKLKCLEGMDSLLSIVQMPRGVPVATVAINNSTNAGLLAVRMLSMFDPELERRMSAFQKEQEGKVMTAVEKIDQVGWNNYNL